MYDWNMLTLNYEYKLIHSSQQATDFEHYLEVCRKAWNYALRERKDWFQSRSNRIDACSIDCEYIIPASQPRPTYREQCKRLTAAKIEFPGLATVHSQILQQVLKTLEAAFLSMWERGFGFPRFKKYGRMRSFVFPQKKTSDIKASSIKLPKIGLVQMRVSRPIDLDIAAAQVVEQRGLAAVGHTVALKLPADGIVAGADDHNVVSANTARNRKPKPRDLGFPRYSP